mmetsp:Transcript_841/g.1365  ORF Transcript_841/g.1365 Transcript_841/m.1365 type:complete len:316 (-) Transcript_841:227-1174(-)
MKTLTDDAVLHIASFMDTADMLNVALTCRRFGSAATDDLSLMERGAHQLIESAPTHEKNWVPYKKGTSTTWIGLYHELLKLRAPPSFSSILGSGINYVNKKYHVYASLREQYQQQQLQQAKWLLRRRQYPLTKHSIAPSSSTVSCVAIGNHIMSHGVHSVKFTMTRVEKISFGIIRPFDEYWVNMNDVSCKDGFNPFESWSDMIDATSSRRKHWGESNVHCCWYETYPGSCQWTDWETTSQTIDDWCGMEHALEGDVGLLLDLDEGTLSVYKNGRRLGIMKHGLSGEYCWLMSIQGASNSTAVQIKRGYLVSNRV